MVGLHPTILSVLLLYVATVGVRTLLNRWQSITLHTVQNEFSARLRQQLYDAIVRTNWLFFSRNPTSDFVHALSSQIDRVSLATQAFLSLLVDVFLGAAYLFLALYLAAPIAIGVSLCGTVLWLVLKRKTNAARATGEAISAASTSLHAAASEHLAGLKAARSYGAQQRNGEIFARLSDDLAQANIAAARNQADVRRWFDLGVVFMLSVIVLILVDVLATPPASLLLILFMFYRLVPRFSSIQRSYQFISSMLPAFAVVTDLQARCEAEAEAEPRRSESLEFRRSVQLENVSFAYTRERNSRPAIEKLSITIPAGRTSAIVGPSGAGKSTVCDLVMGLIVPDEGRLLVDEALLTPERLRSWREQLGYVPQDSFLLHDTVRANLLWARPEATDQQLLEALRLAAADRFVAALPQGVETVVGDRGVLPLGWRAATAGAGASSAPKASLVDPR